MLDSAWATLQFFWAADSKIRHLSTTYNHFVIAIAKKSIVEQGADEAASVCKASTFS